MLRIQPGKAHSVSRSENRAFGIALPRQIRRLRERSVVCR